MGAIEEQKEAERLRIENEKKERSKEKKQVGKWKNKLKKNLMKINPEYKDDFQFLSTHGKYEDWKLIQKICVHPLTLEIFQPMLKGIRERVEENRRKLEEKRLAQEQERIRI